MFKINATIAIVATVAHCIASPLHIHTTATCVTTACLALQTRPCPPTWTTWSRAPSSSSAAWSPSQGEEGCGSPSSVSCLSLAQVDPVASLLVLRSSPRTPRPPIIHDSPTHLHCLSPQPRLHVRGGGEPAGHDGARHCAQYLLEGAGWVQDCIVAILACACTCVACSAAYLSPVACCLMIGSTMLHRTSNPGYIERKQSATVMIAFIDQWASLTGRWVQPSWSLLWLPACASTFRLASGSFLTGRSIDASQ